MRTTLRRWAIVLVVLTVALVAIPAYAMARANGVDPNQGAAEQPANPPKSGDQSMAQDLAPIEHVEIVIAESLPPQYSVHVEFGLANGCIQPGGYAVRQIGNRFEIDVFVLMPTAEDVMCTMEYSVATCSVPLGSGLQPGENYTVDVNGTTVSFTAE